MKLKGFILLLLIAAMTGIVAQNTTPLISFTAQSEKLPVIFMQIAKEYDLKFAYDAELLSQTSVSIDMQDVSIHEFLDTVLKDSHLCHRVIAGTYTIIPCVAQLQHQTREVKGLVMDKFTGEPLPFANIQINNTTWTSSSLLGIFTSKIKSEDSVNIKLSYLGYALLDTCLDYSQLPEMIHLGLSPRTEVIHQVAIHADKVAILEKGNTSDQLVFNPYQATYLPNIGEQDILSAISILPGINTTGESARSLSIRGSSPFSNLIILDGFPVFHLDHFFGHFSAINPKYVKSIKISRGGFGANYGGSIAGVVDITGKTGNRRKPAFDVTANLLSVNALVELPLSRKLSWLISARRSYTDFAETYLFKDLFAQSGKGFIDESLGTGPDYFYDITPQFNFGDYHSKLTYHPSMKETMSFSYYHSKDDLQYAINEDGDDYVFRFKNTDIWKNKGISLEWNKQYSSRFNSRFNGGASRFANESNYSNYWEEPTAATIPISNITTNIINQVEGIYINQESHYTFSDRNTLNFGFNLHLYNIDYSYRETDSYDTSYQIDETIDEKGNTSAIFCSWDHHPSATFKWTTGLRSTYYSPLQRLYCEPRFSIAYKIKPAIELHAETGYYYQFLSTTTQYDELGNATEYWVLGNEDTQPAESYQLQGGLDYSENGFLVNVELYYRNSKGLSESYIARNEDGTSDETTFTYFSHNQKAVGLDMLIKKNFRKYTSIVSYSYSQGQSSYRGITVPSHFDQPHQLKLSGIFRHNNWHFSYIWSYLSGSPYIDFARKDYLSTPNRERLDASHQLDLAGVYNYEAKYLKGQLGLSLINVYNQKNSVRKKFYYANEEHNEFITANINSLSFTPVFFINVKF